MVQTGRIVRLVADKGFGFIRDDNSNLEYFFHRSEFNGHWGDLEKDCKKKMNPPVEFKGSNGGHKGPRASDVKRVDHPNEG